MNRNSRPIFSVVIPVYNVAAYIEQCLESVLAQTFTSFEVICVNDGSPDNSVEIIQSFNDPRIRIINQENRGLSGARNTGIRASQGIYVALLDADDLWLPQKLELHFKHLQSRPFVDISYSASIFINEQGEPMGIGQFPKLTDITPGHIVCRNPVGNGSAPVIRQSLLQRVRRFTDSEDHHYEYFDETLRQSEDVEFWLRAALNHNAVFEGIGEALTCYRVNASGLSANLTKQYESWRRGIKMNQKGNEDFFKRWFPLANAYQKRYLARRAISAGNSLDAFAWLLGAFRSDLRIVVEEPKRTLLTMAAAVASVCPKSIFDVLERTAMRFAGMKASGQLS